MLPYPLSGYVAVALAIVFSVSGARPMEVWRRCDG